jgi:formylglycine-generating enzyme required for sulfatase activity
LLVFLIFYLQKNLPRLTQAPNSTPQKSIILTEAFVPTKTITLIPASKTSSAIFTPTKNKTLTLTVTVAVLQEEIVDDNGATMRLVPAGNFMMGESGNSDEKPIHQVYLGSFYMDKYEVTNALYKACVDAGGCTLPEQMMSYTRSSYYGTSEFENHPVIYVSWNNAIAYCQWRGANLPTEAQWEKAARGTDGRTYPWGEGIDCDKANYSNCKGDTASVGNYESGKSPYGIYDMAGNVLEWVKDWYDGLYYQSSLSSNPMGPDSGRYRVLRGGSWDSADVDVRSANRSLNAPYDMNYLIGFRCAREAKP